MRLALIDLAPPVPIPPPTARSARRRWPAILEGLLWLAALVCCGAVASTLIAAHLYQSRSSAWLDAQRRAADTARSVSPVRIAYRPGAPIARLSIPRLGLSAMVAEGITDTVLERAVGHLPASARPGERGNVALAGHRDTFFRDLQHLRAGDRIVLAGPAGQQEYRVEWTTVVDPRATELAADTGYSALTLITCFPFRYVGSAPYRFVARARQVGRP